MNRQQREEGGGAVSCGVVDRQMGSVDIHSSVEGGGRRQ